jgi:hypothetical protein
MRQRAIGNEQRKRRRAHQKQPCGAFAVSVYLFSHNRRSWQEFGFTQPHAA